MSAKEVDQFVSDLELIAKSDRPQAILFQMLGWIDGCKKDKSPLDIKAMVEDIVSGHANYLRGEDK